MSKRILFVCLGNICRSPSAEAVLRHNAPEDAGIAIDSAGTGSWHVGEPPHPEMRATAKRRGYAMDELRARQVVPEDFERFDVIVAMDRANLGDLQDLHAQSGAAGKARLVLFMDLAPGHGTKDVPDPYFTGDFGHTLDLIEEGVQQLLRDLAQTR